MKSYLVAVVEIAGGIEGGIEGERRDVTNMRREEWLRQRDMLTGY